MTRPLAVLASLAVLLLTPTSTGAQTVPRDPTGLIASDNVELVTSIPNPGVIGARFRGDHMFVTSVATGLTVYDVSEPAAPVRVGGLPLPHFENEDVDMGGNILLISNDSAESAGVLYVIDVADPAAPKLLATHPYGVTNGNAAWAQFFGGPGHTVSCVLECRYAWATDGGGIQVIDLTNPAVPVRKGTFPTPAGGLVTHDVQVDGNGLVWVSGFGGLAAYALPDGYDGSSLGQLVAKTDPSGSSTYIEQFGLGNGQGPNDFILHNSLRPTDSGVVYVTEEDYNRPACQGAGAFETWELPLREVFDSYDPVTGEGIGAPRLVPTGDDLTLIDIWVPELLEDATARAQMCSAHYFDLSGGIVAQGWYEMGVRFLDVSDPTEIRQIGYYAPASAVTWAAYWAPRDPEREVVYVLDASHGIDVIRFDRPATGESPTLRAPIRREWRRSSPAAIPSTAFGYACRIPF